MQRIKIIFEFFVQIKICTARILDPTSAASSDNIIKVTAGLIAALPFVAEIDNLRDCQRQDLRLRIKYPDQNVHFVVPRMRDLKRVKTENGEAGMCYPYLSNYIHIYTYNIFIQI